METGAWGRVIRVDRGECDLVTATGRVRALSDSMRSQDEMAPVTGDWVQCGLNDDGAAVIERVLPRFSALSRRDPAERDEQQVLAANIDVVGIVAGLDRPLPPGRFERMLVMAEDSGARSLVVLTKADGSTDADELTATVQAVAGGVEVIATSIVDGRGLDQLLAHLGAGRTLALVGASGVGKSSLVNALAGADLLETGEVRSGDAKGRHTTVARELVLLSDDAGLVLDTPGVRALGLWEAEEALGRVFGDLEELATACKFSDCRHGTEPGCAVHQAIADGITDRRRVDRYLALTEELASQREREIQRERDPKRSGGRRKPGGGRRRR